jgi:hypothetical protein
MRVNIYAEEMTEKVEVVRKGEFTGIRFYLELPVSVGEATVKGPFLHRPDDDSSAVTFWGKKQLKFMLLRALELLDQTKVDEAAEICAGQQRRLDRHDNDDPMVAAR